MLIAIIIFSLSITVVYIILMRFYLSYQDFYNSQIKKTRPKISWNANTKKNESEHEKCFRQVDNVYSLHISFWDKFHLIHTHMYNTLNKIPPVTLWWWKTKDRMVLEISCLFLVSVVSGKISMLKCSLNFCALLYNNLLIYLNVNIKKYWKYFNSWHMSFPTHFL